MSKGKITLIIVAVIVGLILIMAIGTYNGLVSSSEKIEANLSQIDNQLQRRLDLIPNLVNTVKGYASHEEEIFTNVAEARAKLAGATDVSERAEANDEVNSALSRLLAIAENYPDLKADANFRQLADELAGTENRIANARKDYNDAVQKYNTKIRRFPTSIIANMFGFEKYEYFEAKKGADVVPNVEF